MKPSYSTKHLFSFFMLAVTAGGLLTGCSTTTRMQRQLNTNLLGDSAFAGAHAGICVYEPATGEYLYHHNADKYFVPASNTKIATCYAAMKYLGDSLAGMRYRKIASGEGVEIVPTGDPTLLHTDFKQQPVVSFLLQKKAAFMTEPVYNGIWKEARFGYGWSWDDYSDNYMVERSALPVQGNMARYELQGDSLMIDFGVVRNLKVTPSLLGKRLTADSLTDYKNFTLRRNEFSQILKAEKSGTAFTRQWVPVFNTGAAYSVAALNEWLANLQYEKEKRDDSLLAAAAKKAGRDYLPTNIIPAAERKFVQFYNLSLPGKDAVSALQTVRSQPTDSVLKPMMHRSDNFFAEQLLLMASNEVLGHMDNAAIIQHLLENDFKNIPHKPYWVDGSGLSRYNLFTPQDFVWILQQMQQQFGLERIKEIFPTGGEGTLRTLYKDEAGYIFAKTGTLSHHTALSGFLITKKNKLLVFSVLVNHYMKGSTGVRKAIERFLVKLRQEH
jgi:serine-type D-Ala-D-Ala carboxypeptidase/endopeptidase (penicillin-binding protein 4)